MIVIPSIDILGGKAVQLVGGRPETATEYGAPGRWLKKWEASGASMAHIIDLDAALGKGSNRGQIISLIRSSAIPIQVGGGIRTREIAERYLAAGAERIIFGSRAFDSSFMESLQSLGRSRLMAAIDYSKGRILKNGWQSGTEYGLEAASKIEQYFGSVLYTNVDREGRMEGVSLPPLSNLPSYASGGFSSAGEINLAEQAGFAGVIIGTALYKSRLGQELWK